MNVDFSGLAVALATPFTSSGAIDDAALRRLVRHVRDGGADVLVALGSTGEAAMLTEPERDAVITACLEEAGDRPVVVGTGAAATSQACAFTRRAAQLGADGALVVVPFYVRPTAAGIVAHFRAIAETAPALPLIAYNVPGRTGTNLAPPTLQKLWELPAVVAVKESSGNLQQIAHVAAELPPGKLLLAGDDAFAVPILALGGEGLVSVLGNLLPRACSELVAAARAGRIDEACELQSRLLPVMDALSCEPNPIPLKAGLAVLGLAEPHVRLPLTAPEPSTRRTLELALRALEVMA